MSKFLPGEVNNPHGRPKNTGHRQQMFNALVMPHKEALFSKALELALDGNENMLRLFIERMIPAKPVDEPISLDLPNDLTLEATMGMGKNVLSLLNQGEVTPEQAKSLIHIINFYQGHIAGYELLERIKKLSCDYEKLLVTRKA